jgi:hypothetical protein
MTIRANSDRRFFLRFLLIGLVVAGFGLYCVYDGAIGYPLQRERALRYEEFELEGRLGEWGAFAREQGWMQYIMAGVCGALALWFFSIVLRNRNRWIEASPSGVTSSWGQRFDWADVISVDKKQWKKKGIAKIHYQEGDRRRRFIIDDFKFLRKPTGKILQMLETRVGHDKITGGHPEGYEEAYEESDEQDERAASQM